MDQWRDIMPTMVHSLVWQYERKEECIDPSTEVHLVKLFFRAEEAALFAKDIVPAIETDFILTIDMNIACPVLYRILWYFFRTIPFDTKNDYFSLYEIIPTADEIVKHIDDHCRCEITDIPPCCCGGNLLEDPIVSIGFEVAGGGSFGDRWSRQLFGIFQTRNDEFLSFDQLYSLSLDE